MRIRVTRLTLPLAVLLFLIACGGPQGPQVPPALFSDEGLDGAGQLVDLAALQQADTAAIAAAITPEALSGIQIPDLADDPSLGTGAELEAEAASNDAPTGEDGSMVFVERQDDTYAVRLVDMSSGDQTIVYQGSRTVQSVATSRDGSIVAFTAAGESGDNDLYLIDTVAETALAVVTPTEDERDVSLSLDGSVLVWQGGTQDAPTTVRLELGGEGVVYDWAAGLGIDVVVNQPSVSGDGHVVALVEETGALVDALVGVSFPLVFVLVIDPLDGEAALVPLFVADTFHHPSLDYTGERLVVGAQIDTAEATFLYDAADAAVDILTDTILDHGFLTADGQWLATTLGDSAAVISLATGEAFGVKTPDGAVASAAYWARGDVAAYVGSNDEGTFVRPGDDGIDEDGRTVGYHAYAFEAASSDHYGFYSYQDYDGYLLLYEGSFDPAAPTENLLAANDDWLGSWDDDAGLGTSRIIQALEAGDEYVLVTTACGAPGAPCGPSTGSFYNVIKAGVEPPPPPTVLPPPDDARFNITLRFWNDSLSEEEKAVFEEAAERWSEVIVGDLENIEEFELTEADVTAGAPGIVGVLDDVIIDAAKVPIDGPGGVLARAGARWVRVGGPDHFLPTYGLMEFDEAEFGPGGFFADLEGFKETIMHEMGHVLGISRSFWIPLELIEGNPEDTRFCSDVAFGDDPRYVGAAGNDAWVGFYGADTDTVPLENTNGCGTADSHWREVNLQDELMTGFAQGGGEPLSRVTIGALEDLGYQVDYDAADDWSIPPLPVLRQVSPNEVEYEIVWDFASAYTGSRLDDVEGPVVAIDLALEPGNESTSGCQPADFDGLELDGAIALMQRGGCTFGEKAQNALDAGAIGVIIGNQGDTETRKAPAPGTFGEEIDIVGVPISYDLMVELAELAEEEEVVVFIDTDTIVGPDSRIGPQALPRVSWHIAEEILPLLGGIDAEGNVTYFD